MEYFSYYMAKGLYIYSFTEEGNYITFSKCIYSVFSQRNMAWNNTPFFDMGIITCDI